MQKGPCSWGTKYNTAIIGRFHFQMILSSGVQVVLVQVLKVSHDPFLDVGGYSNGGSVRNMKKFTSFYLIGCVNRPRYLPILD